MENKENTSQIPLIVKKYTNRKYYSAFLSSYLTSQDLFDLILEGTRIEVTEGGEDITYDTLLAILLARLRGDLATLSLTGLYEAIEKVSGGPLLFPGQRGRGLSAQNHATSGAPQAVIPDSQIANAEV